MDDVLDDGRTQRLPPVLGAHPERVTQPVCSKNNAAMKVRNACLGHGGTREAAHRWPHISAIVSIIGGRCSTNIVLPTGMRVNARPLLAGLPACPAHRPGNGACSHRASGRGARSTRRSASHPPRLPCQLRARRSAMQRPRRERSPSQWRLRCTDWSTRISMHHLRPTARVLVRTPKRSELIDELALLTRRTS